MYSRKSFGYTPYNPPPNYNGVAFTRDFRPSSEVPDNPKNEEETQPTDEIQIFDEPEFNQTDTAENNTVHEDFEMVETKPEDRSAYEAPKESTVTSKLIGKDLSLEDLLIIGAVILFVSGEFDGDLMLLLGLLLIAGI